MTSRGRTRARPGAGALALVALGAAFGALSGTGCAGSGSTTSSPENGGPVEGAVLPVAEHVGREACADCHAEEAALWAGSHHDLAMQPANEATVLGDFDDATFRYGGVETTFTRRDGAFVVRTDGPDGTPRDHDVAFTFGVEPLQQYLISFPGGKYQVLSIAWDTRPASEGGRRWFHLYPEERIAPGDPLHWTGRLQNWNTMCAECHSTALAKGYDRANDRYDTTWREIDVSCEACHGPGSRHVAWARQRKDGSARSGTSPGAGSMELVVDLAGATKAEWVPDPVTGTARRAGPDPAPSEIDTCGRCHARRSTLVEGLPEGAPLADTHHVALIEEPLYFADGQIRDEVYVYGSFLQSRMHAAGVTCGDCHEPHALTLRAEGNALCGRCHLPERFDTPEHHFHADGGEGSRCADCHMPARTYMAVDPRRDHSFRVPQPGLSGRIGAPDACTGCHADRTAVWADGVLAERLAARTLPARDPHFGEALHAGLRGGPGGREGLHALATNASAPAIARASALSALEAIAGRETPRVISAAARDASPLVRAEAARLIDRLPAALRLDTGLPLLDDPILGVRMEAAAALSSWPAERLEAPRAERLAEVLEEYRAAQRTNSDRPEAWLNIGNVERNLRRFDDAEAAFRAALRIDPAFAPAWVNRASLARARGRDADGEAILREGLDAVDAAHARASSPSKGATAGFDAARATLRHALGLLLVRQKRRDEGIEELRRAWELSGKRTDMAHAYGVALYSSDRKDEAFAVLDAALESAPYDRPVLQALATMHRDAGNRSAALVHALTLQELDPGEAGVAALVRQLRASIQRSPGGG